MSQDESPNTVRPKNYPADLREVISEALPRIAEELENLKFLAQNSGLETLREIGDLKLSFEMFRDRIIEASAINDQGHQRTQGMLSQILSNRETDRADFDSFRLATNTAIAELRRKLGNGSSNNGVHI